MIENTRREKIRAARLVFRYTYRADPVGAVASAVVTFLTVTLGVLVPLILRFLTDAAVHHDRAAVAVAVLLWVGQCSANLAAYWVGVFLRMGLRERSTLYFDTRMAELAAGIHHLEHHERPDYLDQLFILQHNHQQLAEVQSSVVNGVAIVVRLVVTVVLLGSVDPWLLLLPLAAVPSALAERDAARRRHAAEDQVAPYRRLLYRLFLLGADTEAAKELRVFDEGDDLLARTDRARAAINQVEDRVAVRGAVLDASGWLFFGLAFVVAMLLVAHQAAAGHTSVGDVVLVLTLAGGVNAGLVGLATSFAWLLNSLKTGERLAWLEDLATSAAARATPPEPPGPQPLPSKLRQGIRFEGVSFRYPGTSASVLEGVDLFVPAGSTLALVGDNGAGKTTLCKLLCRFYDPTDGRITVDGVDLASFPVDVWRARLSACFQDFARPELTTGETVGIGDLPRLDDPDAVSAALDRAHAGDVVASLPDGLATQLGRSFDAGPAGVGTVPSMGQWQKLALGRAMMREEPLLLVLDEPTASLDAETEHALFERYASAARASAARSGAITILVSHRFSTVRMADVIVVMAGGRVVEFGSHADLVAAGAGYAELYELQARAYR